MKNSKLKPVVWIISRAFPPVKAIGSDRAVKLVRSFIDANYRVIVFTIKCNDSDLSNGFENDESIQVKRIKMFFSNEFNGEARRSKFKLVYKFVFYFLNRLFGDSGWTWFFQLKRSLQNEFYNGEPHFIFASGSPFISFLAVRNFAVKNKLPYILDYRDLWSRNPHFIGLPLITHFLSRTIERFVNKDAYFLTTVSSGCASILAKDNLVKVLYNIPDKQYIKRVESLIKNNFLIDDKVLNLFFGGTLYPNERDLEPVAKAISLIPIHLQQNIVLHYCGSSSEVAKAAFKKYDLSNNLVDHGMLTKDDVFALMKLSDVTISVVHNSGSASSSSVLGIMTTKIFDYLIVNKHILNIAPVNSELSLWLNQNKFNNIKNIVGEDVEGIKTYFLNILQKEKRILNVQEKNLKVEIPIWENQFSKNVFPLLFNLTEKEK